MVSADERTALIQSFLFTEIAERDDVGETEGEAEQILVPHIGDGVAPIFQRDSAAVPIVGCLSGRELQLSGLGIDAEAAGGAQPAARQAAIANRYAKLLELAGDLVGLRWSALALCQAWGSRLRDLQVRVTGSEGEWSRVVVEKQGAGIDAFQLEVIVEVPLGIGAASGGGSESRDHGRKMTRFSQKGNSGQVFRGCQNVAPPCDQGSSEGRVQEILLRDFPGEDLFHIGTRGARLASEAVRTLPRYRLFGCGGSNSQTCHRRLAFLNRCRAVLGV